ncbi:MAG: hypothetical protein PHD71_05905 [Methanospirillum sp.]|nr:hypothetical protein [Methanospirillum sp.]
MLKITREELDGLHMKYLKNWFVLLFVFVLISLPCLVSGASSESYTNALYAGQNKMYTITVPCTATLVLSGDPGSELSLYAKKVSGTFIPSNIHVTKYADVSTLSPASSQKIYLESGEWFVIVESLQGFTEYTLTIDNECPITTTCYGGPCHNMADCAPPMVYRDNLQTGFLNTGESKTFAYRLTGNRSYVEWVLSGPCDDSAPLMQTGSDVDMFTTRNCGPNLDMYVYKACNPKYSPCVAIAADIRLGSNAYVGISHPEEQVLYYVKVYGKRGSGNYHLTARSYTGEDIVIAGIRPSEYDGYIAFATDVTAPDDLNIIIPVPPTAYTIRASEL